VVIVGGGFGGLYAARQLAGAPVQVTLVDRRNFHLFQPLLYQVATGGLSPAEIASPLRAILARQRNIHVIQGEVVDFDLEGRRVILHDGELPYDSLIVAAGAVPTYFGHPEWEAEAPPLKSLEDALAIRRRIFLAFEAAERQPDPVRRAAWTTFVVVGGGPTGVELAGTLGELAQHTLRRDFRNFDTADSRVLLVEAGPRILPAYPPELCPPAVRSLAKLGVELRTGHQVTDVRPDEVVLKAGDQEERVPTHTILWGAGLRASPLGEALAGRAGVTLDRGGRVVVQPNCSLPGYPEVYVVGDLANFTGDDGKPLPGVAQVAIQGGEFVADRIRAIVKGAEPPPRFRYHDKGTLAVIGRNAAVAAIGRSRLHGLIAWLVWILIHIFYLIGFENKLLVMLQWAWSYVTRNAGARLITPETAMPRLDVTPPSLGDRTTPAAAAQFSPDSPAEQQSRRP
jgi:NADH dehydrogenase